MSKKLRASGNVILKVALWYSAILGGFAGYTNWLPQIRGDAPEAAVAIDTSSISTEDLAEIGAKIIYGTLDPLGKLAKGEGPIGKGQCPLCHRFFQEQKADRCPNMIALKSESQKLLQVTEEERSHKRFQEPRYKESMERNSGGEKDSGIVPHAESGGQYLLESEYCPNCFVVEGFGLKGTNDTVSPMPIINKAPILLTDTEIVAVVTHLQVRNDGDMEKGTAKDDWEAYFGTELGAGEEDAAEAAPVEAGPPVALGSHTPEEIVTKMTCYACHKIPGISVAKTGAIGPLLIEGTNAPNRIKSAAYKKAVAEGKAHATTPREYIIESIIDPSAFIVEGFVDDMMKDFGKKFTIAGLDVLVDYLLLQDEAAAIADGMDRLGNEKEGSILPPAAAKVETGDAHVKREVLENTGLHISMVATPQSIFKAFN